jgi:hypothetical protein
MTFTDKHDNLCFVAWNKGFFVSTNEYYINRNQHISIAKTQDKTLENLIILIHLFYSLYTKNYT